MQEQEISSPEICQGFILKLVSLGLFLKILIMALIYFRNPITAIKALSELRKLQYGVNGGGPFKKLVKSQGRYFWGPNTPCWPSKAFDRLMHAEFERLNTASRRNKPLQFVVYAITSNCSLDCQHCYEWNLLNRDQDPSIANILRSISEFEECGVSLFQFSGGEPLDRFDGLIEILNSAGDESIFWLVTSGKGLTLEKALSLRSAGLSGILISVDHWHANEHDEFRGESGLFEEAMKAIDNTHSAGLVVCLALSATREFTSRENLLRYAEMAHSKKVEFIQILEARSSGRYFGENVELDENRISILENFFRELNFHPDYKLLPSIIYPAFYQRREGCVGSGDRFLYVNSMGEMHSCPFCHKRAGNCHEASVADLLDEIRSYNCELHI